MKRLAFIISLLLLGAAAFVFEPWTKFETDPYAVPDREPIEAWKMPNRAMEAVCLFGPPIMVSRPDVHLSSRLVIFPGPIRQLPNDDTTIYNYVRYHVQTPPNPHGDALNVFDSVEEYIATSVPEELAQYQMDMISGGLPDKVAEVEELLGPPDVVINRKKPVRDRLIWERKMCFDGQLLYEVWVEAIDGIIIKAGGSKTPTEPAREI